jgi:hypothetical protein
MQGFLVRQPHKYQVSARRKRLEEEIDLIVMRPEPMEKKTPANIIWGRSELRHVSRAVIGICGWHTDKITPSVINDSPEIVRFARDEAIKRIRRECGSGPLVKIVCLPDLPASRTLTSKSLKKLQEYGIHGVLLFRTMLLEIAQMIDTHKAYEKSDLLQIIRILKNYDLIKGPQMELFEGRRTGRRRK